MKVSSRLIHPPCRSSPGGAIIIFTSAFILSIVSFTDHSSTWAVALSFILVVLSFLLQQLQALHLSWFTATFVTVPYLFPSLHGWPFLLLLPLLGYCAFALSVPKLRSSIYYMQRGLLKRDVIFLGLLVVFISGIALSAWYQTFKPDLTVQLSHLEHMPVLIYPLAGLGFSLGNAFMEEFVYRGIILQALDSAAGTGFVSLLVQALLFGELHYREGFPNGICGVVMTAVYGIMLGGLRRSSQGMLVPWAVHVVADCMVFTILAAIILGRAG